VNFFLADVVFAKEEWAKLRREGALDFAKRRLKGLSVSLGDKTYLDGERFTIGDLMMATVLRIPAHTDLVTSDTRLGPYLQRCTSRPAFKKAFEAQLNDFKREAA
jgi:glutathione S-transferase